MPKVQKGQTQEEYLKICIPEVLKEKPGNRDFAIAKCIGMFKEKYGQSKASSDNSDNLNTLKDKNPVKMSPTSNPTREESQGKNNLNKNMKTNEDIKNSLPNPIKANKKVGSECGEAKYGIEMTPDNKDNTGCAAEFKGGQYVFNADIRESKVSLVDWSKRPLQLTPDGKSNRVSNLVRNESNASYHSSSKTLCDNPSCKKVLSSHEYNSNQASTISGPVSNNYGATQLSLRDPKDNSYKSYSYCDQACCASHLDKMKNDRVQQLKDELSKHASVHDSDKSPSSDQAFKDSSAAMTEKEKREHHHNTKPYGDVTYADPKNNKYPIDTEKHVRAALSYIGNSKNSGEYSSSELASIKSRIHQAAKKLGIKVND